jgi:hypothetical protein
MFSGSSVILRSEARRGEYRVCGWVEDFTSTILYQAAAFSALAAAFAM